MLNNVFNIQPCEKFDEQKLFGVIMMNIKMRTIRTSEKIINIKGTG